VDPRAAGPASDPSAAYRELRTRRRRDRVWRAMLFALTLVVVALAAATVTLGVIRHHGTAASPPTSPPVRPAARAGSGTTTTTSSTPSGPGPTITALDPSTGSAGQSVTIEGSGLFSADGQVAAHFNGQVVPTACPSQTSCTATVPAGSPGPETVTVSTDAGTSNGLTFTYQ